MWDGSLRKCVAINNNLGQLTLPLFLLLFVFSSPLISPLAFKRHLSHKNYGSRCQIGKPSMDQNQMKSDLFLGVNEANKNHTISDNVKNAKVTSTINHNTKMSRTKFEGIIILPICAATMIN